MDLAYIDNLAVNGKGILHKASVTSKQVMVLLVVISVILAKSVAALSFITLLLLIVMIISGLPLNRLLPLAAYPLFFSVVFALSLEGWSTWAVIIFLRAFNACLVMLLLIGTTPYHRIFSSLRKILPRLVVDGLYLTYRAFFILLEQTANLGRSLRIRGVQRPSNVIKNLGIIGQAFGVVLLQSWEISERMYKVMLLRGYELNIAGFNAPKIRNLTSDIFSIMVGSCSLGMVVILQWI